MSRPGDETWRAISAETIKIPEPIIDPTTRVVASIRPSPLARPVSSARRAVSIRYRLLKRVALISHACAMRKQIQTADPAAADPARERMLQMLSKWPDDEADSSIGNAALSEEHDATAVESSHPNCPPARFTGLPK